MSAWYNENDRQKAATLRNLIEEGAIAPGVVDERSIVEVQPEDLRSFTQCHFFAGGGLWSLCLRNAGWPDDRPVWTGSCPCGPFSKAGLRKGFDDPRHLWPAWFRLIRICRPVVLFGEQSDEADAWLDLVSSDLEGDGYAIGSAIIPAAGFGGAHQRHRIGFVADADNAEWWSERAPWHDGRWPKTGWVQGDRHLGDDSPTFIVADAHGRLSRHGDIQRSGQHRQLSEDCGVGVVLDDTNNCGRQGGRANDRSHAAGKDGGSHVRAPGLFGGTRADWIACRDGRWRPIEPGTFPLVDAYPGRLGLLRLYGDAIDVEAFTNLIGAYLDSAPVGAAA
jgi:DNA (cytosine-5)-methyltransferase 1